MCVHWESGEGALRPPSNPHCRAPKSGSRESGRRCPPLHPPGALMADRRTVRVHARVSPAELADWRAKSAAVGVPLSDLLRQAMARTRTWTAAAAEVERERTRQVAPHRQQPEPGRALGEHARLGIRGRRGDRQPCRHRAGGTRSCPSRRRDRPCTLSSSRAGPARPRRRSIISSASGTRPGRPREGVDVLRGDPEMVAAVADTRGVRAQVHLGGDRLGAGRPADRCADRRRHRQVRGHGLGGA